MRPGFAATARVSFGFAGLNGPAGFAVLAPPSFEGISWMVQTTEGETRLLAAGCRLDQAEPYGDCLTYGPGHYETWRNGAATGLWITHCALWCGPTNTKTGRADASSSTGYAICSSCTPIASS
ncbi:MAG: hypothetical protein WA624_09690 [Methylocella sp.]